MVMGFTIKGLCDVASDTCENTEREMTCAHTSTGLIVIASLRTRKTKTPLAGKEQTQRNGRG
jgi:hypothetical protein